MTTEEAKHEARSMVDMLKEMTLRADRLSHVLNAPDPIARHRNSTAEDFKRISRHLHSLAHEIHLTVQLYDSWSSRLTPTTPSEDAR